MEIGLRASRKRRQPGKKYEDSAQRDWLNSNVPVERVSRRQPREVACNTADSGGGGEVGGRC